MEIDELAEAAYRSRMRALGRRGGTTTKARRLPKDPGYFAAIGARGGRAAAIATRARIAEELAASGEPIALADPVLVSPIGDVPTTNLQPRERVPATAAPTSMLTRLDEILLDLERPKKP